MASGTSEKEEDSGIGTGAASIDRRYKGSDEDRALSHYDEIALEAGEMEVARAVVPEIQEQFPTCRCRLNEDKNLIAFSVDLWDDEQRMKHQLFLRLGRIRQSDRKRQDRISKVISGDHSSNLEASTNGSTEDDHSTWVQTLPPFLTKPKLYYLANDLKVWVYQGDILKIKVDSIISPANKKLKRYGRLEKKISKAAGPKVDKEKKEFVKQFKEVKKGLQCVTSAGNLDFKKIIHMAGPKWKYYKPHTEADVQKCESDLFYAVYISLVKARELGHASTGLPAIGAGNGKIPFQLCCVQYVQAVIDFSDVAGPRSSLKEVHFCDCNPDLVATLQETFKNMVIQDKETTAASILMDSQCLASDEDPALGHYDEIALRPEEMEIARIAVPEIQKQFPTCRSYLDEERNLVALSVEVWDDEQRMKHQLLLRLGRIRQSGRDRKSRIAKVISGGDSFSLELSTDGGSGDDRTTRVPTPPPFSAKAKLYNLANELKVWVYQGDILRIKVDSIISPANKKLKRYGSLAQKIAKVAGPKVDKEKREYIKQFKEVKKGLQCVTSAGNLDFKQIVHMVGPKWKYYKPHTEADVKECESDIFYAVYISLVKARELGHASTGLPAIGAGNGKIPSQLCCVQYVQAVIDFSEVAGSRSSLKEVHFCDCNPDLVATLQETFDIMVNQGKSTNYDKQAYIKRKH